MPTGLTPLNLQEKETTAKPQDKTETFKAKRKRIKQEMIKPTKKKDKHTKQRERE